MTEKVQLKDVPWYVWVGYLTGIIAWFLNIFRPHLALFAVAIVFLVGTSVAFSVMHKETN